MNVQTRAHILRTFITILLVCMHQKKIALEIAAEITSVNGPQGTFSGQKHASTVLVTILKSIKICLLYRSHKFAMSMH
jgi:hypothetical protein